MTFVFMSECSKKLWWNTIIFSPRKKMFSVDILVLNVTRIVIKQQLCRI